MKTHHPIQMTTARPLPMQTWAGIGLLVAGAAIVAVLAVQALALVLWPAIGLFKPLDSYPRSALFTLVPALVATALFAWLARRQAHPERRFLQIAGAVLVLSVIPDFLLPVDHRTLLASSVTAMLHVVAAALIVGGLVAGYRWRAGRL